MEKKKNRAVKADLPCIDSTPWPAGMVIYEFKMRTFTPAIAECLLFPLPIKGGNRMDKSL